MKVRFYNNRGWKVKASIREVGSKFVALRAVYVARAEITLKAVYVARAEIALKAVYTLKAVDTICKGVE
ncbi:MAG: hypothetical protein KUG79_09390 [Pseudomonadales bacterium]|nr:hypothetical protein [Pseudomonadales bacterium]